MADPTEEELERAMLQVSKAYKIPDSIFDDVVDKTRALLEKAGVKPKTKSNK